MKEDIKEIVKIDRALQGILMAGEKFKEKVLSGEKTLTIRAGYRSYTEGPVLIGCHILNWAVLKTIITVQHKQFKDITIEEKMREGFANPAECLPKLKQYYPNMGENSPITLIEWK